MHHKTDRFRTSAVLAVAAFLLFFMALPAISKEAAITALSDTAFMDNGSKKSWCMHRSKRIKKEDDATAYLERLNQGEFSDWRFPTKEELFKLFSIFDLKEHGNVKIRLEGAYWLTDDKGKIFTGAWEIGDQCGPSRTFYKEKSGYVRAIRP